MNALEGLPSCPIWRIEAPLKVRGVAWHCMEGRADGEPGAGHEIALVTDDGRPGGTWTDRSRRGVATLLADEDEPLVEMGETPDEIRAIYQRAVKRLGWKGTQLATIVYGSMS